MGTYRQIIYQIVFATKYRERTINELFCEKMYGYICGIIKNRNCHPYRVNGIEDHIHICSDLHPSISLADYVREIKVASTKWMKESGLFPLFRGWQEGYGAFTYSIREKQKIINYVNKQKEHHKREKSIDEFRRLLVEHDVQFEEQYLI